MKTLFKSTMAVIVAMAAISCQQNITPEEVPALVKHIKAYTDNSPETKTALNGKVVEWEVGDAITVFDDEGTPRPSGELTAADIVSNVADFTITGMAESAGVFAAVYPADATAKLTEDLNSVNTTFPSVQTARKGSFGKGANLAVASTVSSVSDLSFKNVGGLLALTVGGANVADVTSIELTANKVLGGPVTVAAETATSIATSTDDAYKTVSLEGSFEEGGTYYFSVLPGTYSDIKIVFKRQGYTATYNNPNPLTVKRNSNTNIGSISIAAAKWEAETGSNTTKTVEFSTLGFASWGKDASFSGNTYDEVSQSKDGVTITYSRNSGSLYANTNAIRFYKSNTIKFDAPEGYSITAINWEGSSFKNDATTDVDTCKSTTSGLSWSGNESSVVFTRPSDAASYMNLSSVSVTLVGGTTTQPSEPVDASWSVNPESVYVEVGQSASITVDTNYDGTLSVACAPGDKAEATISGNTITVTGKAEGTATLSITGEATSKYNAISKTVDVTVTVPVITYSTIGEIFDGGEGNYSIQNAVVMAKSAGNVILGDATANIMLYESGNTLEVGQVLTLKNQAVTERNGLLQFDTPEYTVASNKVSPNYGTAIDMLTDSDITSWSGNPQYQYIHVVGVMQSDNRTVRCGSNGIYIAATEGYSGKKVEVYAYSNGVVSKYGTITSTLVTIEEVAVTSYSVSVGSGITHGTVVASQSSAIAGTEVTLTVTPDEHYKLESLSVLDALGNEIEVVNNKFVMPESNVTVSASFVPGESSTVSFDFSSASAYGYDNPAKGGYTQVNSGDSFSENDVVVSFSFKDGNGFRFFSNTNTGVINLRGYVGSEMIITAPTGKKIKFITMSGSNLNSSYISGSVMSSSGGTTSYDSASVTISIIKSTVQIDSMSVVYE